MADRAEWQNAVEAEVRALGRELDVPPATDLTIAVRRRLEGPAVRRGPLVMQGMGTLRRWRPEPPGYQVQPEPQAFVIVVLVLTYV